METVQSNIQQSLKRGVDQATSGARGLIEEKIGRENVSALVGMLAPIGDFSMKTFRSSVDYTRRHPVRVAAGVAGVVCAGLLATWFARSSDKTFREELH